MKNATRPASDLAIRKTAYAIVFIALGVALSPFTSFPVGIAKVNPTQHFLNVTIAILLGTPWAVGCAAATSLARVLLGTGTILAFPGSMFGALLAGIAFRVLKRDVAAAIGEVIGTGILASLACALWVAPALIHKTVGLLALGASFAASSLAGALIALAALAPLRKARLLPRLGDARP